MVKALPFIHQPNRAARNSLYDKRNIAMADYVFHFR